MNERNAKQLRKLAKGLPVVWIVKMVPTMVLGKQLTKRQREFIPGKVQPLRSYKVDIEVSVKEDHVKRVFKIYELQGEEGLSKYVAWVERAHRKQSEDFKKYPHRNPDLLNKYQTSRLQKFLSFLKNIFFYKEKQLNTINS